MPNNQLDPQAVALAKSIRETESGGKWDAKGGSGEWGGYQFMPDTWAAYSKEVGVNAPFGSATPDQQNEVAYKKIKQWKDQGYNVGQIASMWNAGAGRPNAYKEGWKGVNDKGVAYDTPAYAEKVAQAYQKNKAQQTLMNRNSIDTPELGNGTLMENTSGSLAQAGTKLAGAIGDAASGKINPLSGLIRGAGAIGEGVTNVTGDVLKAIPVVGSVVEGAEKTVGAGVQSFMDTPTGQGLSKSYAGFAEKHPELAGNIEAGADVLGAIPVLKGLGFAKNKAKEAVGNAIYGKSDPTLDMVSKDLTPKRMAEAVANRGVEKKGLAGVVSLKPDPRDIKTRDVLGKYVDVKPDKGFLYNIAQAQSAERKLNTKLRSEFAQSAGDRLYSYRELASTLRNIERPTMLKSDTQLNNAYDLVVAKALEIAKKKKGKVSNLLDVRQEFDRYVKKEIPNVFGDVRSTIMSNAVRDIRNALNRFTVDSLPEASRARFKEGLLEQHHLLRAIENMSTKASKGSTKEIGLSRADRLSRKYPKTTGLIKGGAQAAAQGAGLGGFMKLMD